jgi:predicted nuclease of restriction endonuclease-like (RecB) superfamily
MPDDVFRNPYLSDSLGLEEKTSYVETDLEEAIITFARFPSGIRKGILL